MPLYCYALMDADSPALSIGIVEANNNRRFETKCFERGIIPFLLHGVN